MTKLSQSRLRALHPETEPVEHHDGRKRIEITVEIEQYTYDRLARFAERGCTFRNVEQAVNNAIDVVSGRAFAMNHLRNIARLHGTTPETLLFGDIDGSAERQAVSELFSATETLARFVQFGRIEEEEALSVAKLLAIFSLSLQGQRSAAANLLEPAPRTPRLLNGPVPNYTANFIDDDDGIPF